MLNLGDVAKDTITGFVGVVVAQTTWLHGCRRFTLQPQGLFEGKPIDSQTFDEPQLTLVKAKTQKATTDGGGPRPEPRRR